MAGWLGIEITTLTGGITSLLLAVCLSITVHLMSRFYHYLKQGVARKEAARLAIEENLVPTLLTTLTTAVAFFSCMSADLKIVAGFGELGGVGTLLAWVLTYTLIGVGLLYFPIWRGKGAAEPSTDKPLMEPSPRALAYVDGLQKLRWPILAFTVLFCAVGAYAAANVQVATNPLLSIARGHPARDSAEFILDEMGMLTFEMIVEAGEADGIKDPAFLRKVKTLQDDLLQREGVTSVMSVVDILEQVHQAVQGGGEEHLELADTQAQVAQELFIYTMGLPQGVSLSDRVTVDNDALRVSVSSRILRSDEHIELVEFAAQRADELGLDVSVTGLHNMYQISSVPIVRSVLRSTLLALLGVAVILGLALRSVRLVTVSMVVNTVPLFVGALVFWLAGRPLDVGTVIGFSLALGIAVDDTVHIVVHYLNHRSEGESPRRAMGQVITHVVPALLTTTAILLGSCAVFLLGDYVPTFWFGVLLSSILVSALATDLTLLPTLFLLMGGDEGEAEAA
jgi:predicted RND superfamily exporter protein